MNDRFAPRLADVSGPPRRSDPPPTIVEVAVRLLWASLALGIPSALYEVSRSTDPVDGIVTFIGQSATLALGSYVILGVYRGKNWARIVSLLLTLLEVPLLFFGFAPPGAAVIEVICNWVAGALDVVALYLLFTSPGSKWFNRSGVGA